MKLVEITADKTKQKATNKWLKDHTRVKIEGFNVKRFAEIGKTPEISIDLDGKIHFSDKIESFEIYGGKVGKKHLAEPIKFDPPDQLTNFISGNVELDFFNYILTAKDLPNCREMFFTGSALSGFSDIKKLTNLETIGFDFSTITGGLLGLLKLPKLATIENYVEEKDPTAFKALNIIKKHLKDKDLLACQDELIDADLEEYAKL